MGVRPEGKRRWGVASWDHHTSPAPLLKGPGGHCPWRTCHLVCVSICVCVWEKKKAWVGLPSSKPRELLLCNASGVVVMIFFWLGASFTKLMVIFGPFLLAPKSVAPALPYKTSPWAGSQRGDWWSQRNLSSTNVFQDLGHISISIGMFALLK